MEFTALYIIFPFFFVLVRFDPFAICCICHMLRLYQTRMSKRKHITVHEKIL